MSQLQFSLSDLLARQMPIQWHEAVAIVLDVAEWFERGVTRGVVPGLGDVALTDEGRLLLRTAGGTRTPEPVRALARLLDELLKDTPAPQELRLLTRQDGSGTTVHATVEEFGRALAFFARPDRATDLLALSQRAILELERTNTEQEMQRLRSKMEESAGRDPKKTAPGPDRALIRRVLVWGGAALALAVAGWAGWTYRVQIEAQVDRVTTAALERFGGLTPADPTPVDPAGAPTAAARPASRPPVPRAGASRPAGTSPAPTAAEADSPRFLDPALSAPIAAALPDAPSAAAPTDAGPPGAPATMASPGATSPPADGRAAYFTSADTDVVPAELARPQFPTSPGREAAGTEVEIVIDEAGRVESVRWLQFEDRYQSRMMASAIKAWRFVPAKRNGVPVKYVKRMRLQ
jgi:hypothetical protein